MNTKDLAETIIWFGEFHAGADDKKKDEILEKATILIKKHCDELKDNALSAVVSKRSELFIAVFNDITGEDIDCLLAEKFEEVADRRLSNL